MGDKQRLTGSATAQCDSVLQFIAETNSQYNLAPAKLTPPMIPTFSSTTHLVLLHNTSYNGTHAHRRSKQRSQLQGPISYAHALNNIP